MTTNDTRVAIKAIKGTQSCKNAQDFRNTLAKRTIAFASKILREKQSIAISFSLDREKDDFFRGYT